MPLDPQILLDWTFEPVVQKYTEDDTIRYALSVGLAADPLDESQLRYVTYDGLKALPSMATVLAGTGPWTADPRTGVTRSKLVHGQQTVQIHRDLPPAATVVGTARVTTVVDLGADRGAVIYVRRELHDHATGDHLATLDSASVCRADGGFGGTSDAPFLLPKIPETAPDESIELATLPQSALLYQLNGDRNPLHTSPAYARKAGFPAPILHGLCTFGVATHAVVRALAVYDASRVQAIGARFSAPVFPGETLIVDVWKSSGSRALLRAFSKERNVKVLDNGYAELRPL